MSVKHTGKDRSTKKPQPSPKVKSADHRKDHRPADVPGGFSIPPAARTALIYAAAIAGCLLGSLWVLKLWQADLSVPFTYNGDGLVNGVYIKGIIDNGWFFYNQYVGAPTGLTTADFPTADTLHLILIKVISLFTRDFATTLNIFFLATFPLTTASSLFVFRKLKIPYPTAVFGSLLFTFLPYHLFRGESHLFLAAIYVIPLTALLILRIGSDSPPFIQTNKKGGVSHDLSSWRTVGFAVIAMLTASSGIYYAFFACFFLLAAGIYAAYRRRSLYRLLVAVVAVAIIGVVMLVNLGPTISYQSRYGDNEEAAKRLPIESAIYGMTVSQLILPITNHRLGFMADLKTELSDGGDYVRQNLVFYNENDWSSLGLIGSLGLLLSLGWLIAGRRSAATDGQKDGSLLETLGVLNIAGILLATMGGLGLVFALLVSPNIRAYTRISPYIAFFSIAFVLVLLERLRRRYFTSGSRGPIFYFILLSVLILGVLDQTSDAMVPAYDQNRTDFASDEAFFHSVERVMPIDAQIFQLPYMTFPEGGGSYHLSNYDHFRAYLHSQTLHWSYGAMKGRPGDKWQASISSEPVGEMLDDLIASGFKGIYINRTGYKDGANGLQKALETVLEEKPLTNADNTLLFFSLVNYKGTN